MVYGRSATVQRHSGNLKVSPTNGAKSALIAYTSQHKKITASINHWCHNQLLPRLGPNPIRRRRRRQQISETCRSWHHYFLPGSTQASSLITFGRCFAFTEKWATLKQILLHYHPNMSSIQANPFELRNLGHVAGRLSIQENRPYVLCKACTGHMFPINLFSFL